MKYFAFGHVLPERVNVNYNPDGFDLEGLGSMSFVCDASQMIITFEPLKGVELDIDSIYILIKRHAQTIISCIGFSLNYSYTLEITSITDEDLNSWFYGVGILGKSYEPYSKIGPECDSLIKNSGTDFFIRQAVVDYVSAIRSEMDLPFLCYRAIESIKGSFKKQLSDKGTNDDDSNSWRLMHESLGTNREEIIEVQKYAAPLRHGNHHDVKATDNKIRQNLLGITEGCIKRYNAYLSRLKEEGSFHGPAVVDPEGKRGE